MAPQAFKTVLITGCSDRGIGSALATSFHKRGFQVFATARSLTKMSKLQDLPNVTLLQLDVTSQESVENARARVIKEHGKLDVLVNNAGAVYVMPAIDSDLEASKQTFDINFWGTMRMTKAFSPLVIAAKGCIVNNCSVNAYLNVPYMSIYGASKTAQELYSETLRVEMQPFDVRVLTLVTGVIRTQILENVPEPKLPEGSPYAAAEKALVEFSKGSNIGDARMDADVYAERIVSDIMGRSNGRIYRGKFASTIVTLSSWLPTWIVDSMLARDKGLNLVK